MPHMICNACSSLGHRDHGLEVAIECRYMNMQTLLAHAAPGMRMGRVVLASVHVDMAECS